MIIHISVKFGIFRFSIQRKKKRRETKKSLYDRKIFLQVPELKIIIKEGWQTVREVLNRMTYPSSVRWVHILFSKCIHWHLHSILCGVGGILSMKSGDENNCATGTKVTTEWSMFMIVSQEILLLMCYSIFSIVQLQLN